MKASKKHTLLILKNKRKLKLYFILNYSARLLKRVFYDARQCSLLLGSINVSPQFNYDPWNGHLIPLNGPLNSIELHYSIYVNTC